MPPSWMWPFDDKLEIWFDRVKEDREAKYGGGSTDDEGTEESGGMMQNELVAQYRDLM